MTPHGPSEFVSGVVEGFYGEPWTLGERTQLFDWMAAWGLNTYLYAPKDDLHHRALWREPYAPPEADGLRHLIEACRARGLRFVYGVSPGLDIRYSSETDLDRLRARFVEMLALGCSEFTLLFDDIPDAIDGRDLERWGSLAQAQCHVANVMFDWTRARQPESRFFFCPTAYCGRMAAAHLGGKDYLPALGRELQPEIGIFWTGPEIVSSEITVEHVRELQAVLGRKPIIWDNLHANDYDGRRFFCGPYAGRAPRLRDEVAGVLSNPNTEFPLNYVPLRTLAAFMAGPEGDPRSAYLAAMREWAPAFTTIRGPVSFEDLVLFGDCYYLPYEEGPEAAALYEDAATMVKSPEAAGAREAFRARATRLRAFCAATTEVCNRPLFHALSRRTWELREELDLLERFAARATAQEGGIRSDFHLPGTFRGGIVARLQQLLVQQPDGAFNAAPSAGRPE